MRLALIVLTATLTNASVANAWQLIKDEEDAFGTHQVQVADIGLDGSGLTVSCNANKEFSIAYIVPVPPSIIDKLSGIDATDKIQSELALKLQGSSTPITLQTSPTTWNENHMAFATAPNTPEVESAAVAIAGAKGKLLVGIKMHDGNKITSQLGTSQASLIKKVIEACK